jgi:hypothetical protein
MIYDYNGNYLYTTSTATVTNLDYFANNITIYPSHEMAKVKPVAFFTTEMVEGAMLPESDLDWLERRVEEICWEPA